MSLVLNQYSILPIPNDNITAITIDGIHVHPGYLLSFPNLTRLNIISTDVNLNSLPRGLSSLSLMDTDVDIQLLPRNLVSLSLINVGLVEFPWRLLTPTLQHLILDSNDIDRIDPGPKRKLITLSMRDNMITDMTNLGTISDLDELDLSYNDLTIVTDMIWNIHDKVNLSYNNINDIQDLNNIQILGNELDLSYNNLTYDDLYLGGEFVIHPLYSLDINLIGNPIDEIPLELAYMGRRSTSFNISPTNDDIEGQANQLLIDLNAYRHNEWNIEIDEQGNYHVVGKMIRK